MEFSVAQIAQLIGGKVEGDPRLSIFTLAKIEEATPGCIAFLSNPKYESYLYTTQASAVIVQEELSLRQAVQATLIRVNDPYLAFTTLLEFYIQHTRMGKQGIEQPSFRGEGVEAGDGLYLGAFAYIGAGSRLGKNVKVYPQVYIGDQVVIGDNTILYPGVKVYGGARIGKHCTLHAGAIIGSDGFGFAPQADGSYKPIPQVGNVVLEDHVSIGANTVIDCATMGSTLIQEGVKLDNLIQIAHNVEIGRHTVIAAQSGVAGSAKIGSYCIIGGQVGLVGHISLADKTKVGAQSGIGKTVKEEGLSLQGSPAFDYRQQLKCQAVFRRLPELEKKVEDLKAMLSLLKSDLGS
jgi:UDP-3-O-[3-hydroxymyristoyl] glucosamine N-acyltransferase